VANPERHAAQVHRANVLRITNVLEAIFAQLFGDDPAAARVTYECDDWL
jgi:hypothetical protein